MPRRVRKKQTKKPTPVLPAPEADDDDQELGWYVIKDIIDERRVRGKVEYLVDWEDNPDTGKSYDPTWTKSRDVSKEARNEWQKKKAAKKQKPQPPDQQPQDYTRGTGPDTTQSPQPGTEGSRDPNTTKSHLVRSRSSTADESEQQPERKKPKLDHIVSRSQEIDSSFPPSAPLEPAKPICERSPSTSVGKILSVVIKRALHFNPTDYRSTHGASQTALLSSQPITEPDSFSSQPSVQTIPDSQDPAGITPSLSTADPARGALISSQAVIPDSQDPTQGSNETQHHHSINSKKSLISLPNENQDTVSSDTSRDIPSHQPNRLEIEDRPTQDSAPGFTQAPQSGSAPDGFVCQRIEEPAQLKEQRATVANSTPSIPLFSENQSSNFSDSSHPNAHQHPPLLHLEQPSDRLSQAAQILLRTFVDTPFSSSTPDDDGSVGSPGQPVYGSADSPINSPELEDATSEGEVSSIGEASEVSPEDSRVPGCLREPTKENLDNSVHQSHQTDFGEEGFNSFRETSSGGDSPESLGGEPGGLIHQGSSRDFVVELDSPVQANSADTAPKSLDEEANHTGADVGESAEASSENQSFKQVQLITDATRQYGEVVGPEGDTPESSPKGSENSEKSRSPEPALEAPEQFPETKQTFFEGKDPSETGGSSEAPETPSEPTFEGTGSFEPAEQQGEVTEVASGAQESILEETGSPEELPPQIEESQFQVEELSFKGSEVAAAAPRPPAERATQSEAPQPRFLAEEDRPEVPEPLVEAEEPIFEAEEIPFEATSPRSKGTATSPRQIPSILLPSSISDEKLGHPHQSQASCEAYDCDSATKQDNRTTTTREQLEKQTESSFSPSIEGTHKSPAPDPRERVFEPRVEPACTEQGDLGAYPRDRPEKNKQACPFKSQEPQINQGNKTEQRPATPCSDEPSLGHHNARFESQGASARSLKSGSNSNQQGGTPTNNVSEPSIAPEPQSHQPRSLRQSAKDIVQEILDSWGKENSHPLSTEMFPSTSTPSDPPTNHGVSAITELQNLWDSDDEVVVEPQTAGSKTDAGASLSLGLTSSGTSEIHGDLSNPAVSPEFLSQAAPWTSATATELPHIGAGLTSSVEMPQRSAADSMRDIINQAYGASAETVTMTLMPPPTQDIEPVTVSPADISIPTEAEKIALPVMPLSSNETFTSVPGESSGNSISMAQLPQTDNGSSSSSSPAAIQNDLQINYVVTVPFQSSIRSLYDDLLLKSRRDITEFGSKFTQETFTEPDKSLVQKIDTLFSDLQNLCDYPQDIIGPSVKDMPPEEKVKYSLDANAKLSFINELFLQTKTETRVLIVARSPNILRMLCDLAEFLELECVCDVLEYKPKKAFKDSTIRLTLVPSESAIEILEFDVVLGYDNTFQESPIAQALAWDNGGKVKPLVLKLATAYSIEHLSMEIPDTNGNLERRNALLYAIVQIRDTLRDPPRLMEPHSVATIFSDYLNDEAQSILWEPATIPSHALDSFANSQDMGQMSLEGYLNQDNGRKHRLDDEDDPDSKRQRVHSICGPSHEVFDIPPLSDQVKGLLESVNFVAAGGVTIEDQLKISLNDLEKIAEKVAEADRIVEMNDRESNYKSIISRLEKQVKEFERTNDRFYESHRAALQDRTKFEADALKAEAKLQQHKEAAQAADDKHRQKIAQLEEAVARLMKESPAGENEKLIQEVNSKVKVLEKRLETSHKNEEYVRQLYQDATASTSALRAETENLKELNEDLKMKASGNLKSIHEINNNNTAQEYLRQISDLQVRLRDRELELDRAREDLRQLKNGRRETRQVSVPRSPRMGMMSPRPGRTALGTSSRAASPAPVFDNGAGVQPGNGRFSHLRE